MLLFNQETHLYYLQITILIYLSMPILSNFTHSVSKRTLEYTLFFWLVFGILYPTLLNFWPFDLIASIGLQYMINMSFSAIGYCLLGYYLKKYPLERKRSWTVLFAGLLIVYFGTVLGSMAKGQLYSVFLEGMSIGVCLYAAGMYSLLIQKEKVKSYKLVTFLSNASFSLYLTHVFFIYLWIRQPWMDLFTPYPLFRMSLNLLIVLQLSPINLLIIYHWLKNGSNRKSLNDTV